MNPLYCDRLPFVELSDENYVEDHNDHDDDNLKIHNIIHILVWTKFRLLCCYINVHTCPTGTVWTKNLNILFVQSFPLAAGDRVAFNY